MNTVPKLRSGDHLTRVEFERRYSAMPDCKAELIDGVVYVASPLSVPHARFTSLASHWLNLYADATPGMEVLDNATTRLDEDNEPQPDVCLVRKGHPVEENFLARVPPLVVEVAYTSAAIDLHKKKDVYRRHGCREYVVVVIQEQLVRWFVNDEGTFVELARADVLKSRELPGLWLDVPALFDGDRTRLLETLRAGLAARHS